MWERHQKLPKHQLLEPTEETPASRVSKKDAMSSWPSLLASFAAVKPR